MPWINSGSMDIDSSNGVSLIAIPQNSSFLETTSLAKQLAKDARNIGDYLFSENRNT